MTTTKNDDPVAAAITEILLSKTPDGDRKYGPEEVRDFAVSCVLELGLEITSELKPVMLEFCGQFELPADASGEVVNEAMRQYFVENPLNADMLKAIETLSRGSLLGGEHGYKDRGEQIDALKKIGNEATLSAPEAKMTGAKPKVKKGL